jgi:hypothetical protein
VGPRHYEMAVVNVIAWPSLWVIVVKGLANWIKNMCGMGGPSTSPSGNIIMWLQKSTRHIAMCPDITSLGTL